ncbi:MAG TPA: tetratricopeptide repeat protein [Bryobacteraceae bacterium]|nr:tetratricopeptide repeat protein [Bryobacteraceae bacterium]
MRTGPPKEQYTRDEARRVLGIRERQLCSWEQQGLVPHLEEFAFSDLIALTSIQKLRKNRVSPQKVRQAVGAIRKKLRGVENPFKELKIFSEGRNVAVVVDGQKMEAVSGQLLLNFDRESLAGLLAFPRARQGGAGADPGKAKREAEEWFEKGLELEEIGAPSEEIVDAYQKALEYDPASAGALVNLGTVHFHLKAWRDAERCYKQALEIDAGYALAHFNLGNLYDETGRRDLASTHYHAAVQANPSYADAYYNLALLCQSHGDLMEAVRHWKTYLKLDGSSTWAAIARRELEKLRRAAILPGGHPKSETAS